MKVALLSGGVGGARFACGLVSAAGPDNVAVIGNKIYVSYAPPPGVTARVKGVVDRFNIAGEFEKRLITGGKLDGPWGMVLAPTHWGRFGGALLVVQEDGHARQRGELPLRLEQPGPVAHLRVGGEADALVAAGVLGRDDRAGDAVGGERARQLRDGHDAEHVQRAITAKMGQLPAPLLNSLTWDQGAELALHRDITASLDMQVYFCDPHSPWQRGTNENTNGLLRQYFPKGTDLSAHGADDLAAVAAALNGRPRKTLGWRTPAEALDEVLRSAQAGVATTA